MEPYPYRLSAAYFYLHLRHNLLYAPSLPLRQIAPTESLYQASKFQQVRDPEERPLLPHDDLGIGSNYIYPLRRNRANGLNVDPQQ